jgi:hypothetical protein
MTFAKVRELSNPLTIYSEEHHILPRCLYPQFENFKLYPENKAVLTPEEHYVAHLLLIKMNRYKNHTKYRNLVYGASLMTVKNADHGGGRSNNKLYGWVKRLMSELRKGKTYDEIFGPERAIEIRAKMSAAKTGERHPNYGKHLSEVVRNNISLGNLGKVMSEEACKNISNALLGNIPWNTGLTMDDPRVAVSINIMNEKKQIQIDSGELKPWNLGIPQSEPAKEKNRIAHAGKKQDPAHVANRVSSLLKTNSTPGRIHPMTGFKHSDASKENMRVSQRKRPFNWQRDINGDYWLITNPNNTVLIYFGRKAMLDIFTNITAAGLFTRIKIYKKEPAKRINGYRIDKINNKKELFHYMGMQFCGTKR